MARKSVATGRQPIGRAHAQEKSTRETAPCHLWDRSGGLAALVTGSVVAASAAAPVNTKEPSISGSPIVGKDLTGDAATGPAPGSPTRTAGSAANVELRRRSPARPSTKYTLVSADLGATIRFEVTATNADGQGRRDLEPDGAGHERHRRPRQHLAADDRRHRHGGHDAHVDAPARGSATSRSPTQYQWQRCDKNGNACKNIGGATKRHVQARRRRCQLDDPEQGHRQECPRQVVARSPTQTALVGTPAAGSGGGKSIDVTEVPKGERLIVDAVTFSPNPVRRAASRSRSRSR